MFENWHVMRTIDGIHKFYHGDLSEYDPWDLEDMVEIPESEYTAEDILYLTDLIASDNGLVSMSFLYDDILNILRETMNSTPTQEKAFALKLRDLVYKQY